MPPLSSPNHCVIPLPACTPFTFLLDVLRSLGLCLRPSPALSAEHLFLRKQLTLAVPHAWSADTVEMISVDLRGPPDGGLSRFHAQGAEDPSHQPWERRPDG